MLTCRQRSFDVAQHPSRLARDAEIRCRHGVSTPGPRATPARRVAANHGRHGPGSTTRMHRSIGAGSGQMRGPNPLHSAARRILASRRGWLRRKALRCCRWPRFFLACIGSTAADGHAHHRLARAGIPPAYRSLAESHIGFGLAPLFGLSLTCLKPMWGARRNMQLDCAFALFSHSREHR